MDKFLANIRESIPDSQQESFQREVKELVDRMRKRLLGEVQMLLASYNISKQADLDQLRKEVDRIFLEDQES